MLETSALNVQRFSPAQILKYRQDALCIEHCGIADHYEAIVRK